MVFTFIIDDIINPYLPSLNLSKHLPRYIGRFLGYHKLRPRHDYYLWIDIFLSTFVGILLIEGIFRSSNVFTTYHHAPIILASYGATAILTFNVNTSPLAQPRNVFFGHFIASLIGVCIQKLFSLSETGINHYYISGALSVSVASVVLTILNCAHPPAGASALLPSIDEQIRQMSWWYLPVQIISSILMIVVACIMGNIIRVYPTYWWSPLPLGQKYQKEEEEKEVKEGKPKVKSHTFKESMEIVKESGLNQIIIKVDSIIIPDTLELEEIQIDWLNTLKLELLKLDTINV
ncbi:unnamed protein product [Candida verbasci]|uniref:HPP transmembrane region domain-containing protein n=1 Tax=Candida verbasci TaxID=1227364 RepID=A0A9W4U1B5_9ASCO|nr:unnamed protein product [Candida verbasci]